MCKVICNKAFFKTANKSNRACLVPAVLRVRLGRDGSFLAEGDNSSSGTGVSSGKGSGGGLGMCAGYSCQAPRPGLLSMRVLGIARQWSLPPGPSSSTPRQALRDPSRSPSHGSPGSAGPVAAHSSRRHSGDTRLPPFLVLGDSTIKTPQIQGVSQRNPPHNTTKAFPVRWCGQAEPCVSAEGGQSWGRRRWNVGTRRASRPRTGWQLPPRPCTAP